MSDRREGDRYEEFHVGGHQATVHAGSNYNTYTINNTYHLYGPDARIPEVQHHEQIREERDQQALPTYPSQSLVQHGPIYNTNTYTITNNYNYYNRPPSPRQLSQDAGNTHQPQSQSSTPPLVGSGNQSESSSSLDVSMTEDSHVGETISSDSNSERTSNQVFQSSHYTERVQFSITTVKGARNTAFVGREVLMSHITEQISKYCEIQQGQNRRPPHGSAEMSPPRASAPFLPTQPSRSGSEPRSGNLSGYNSNNPADSRTHVPPTVGSSMSDHTRSPNVCVLSGLGGSGKTQMALEYYYEHRHEYFAVFWIDCEHDWTLSTDFAKISAAVIKIATDRPEDSTRAGHCEAIEASRAWLQTTEHRWLCIFDNVEDFGHLSSYLPVECRCNGTILITTQLPTLPAWLGEVSQVVQMRTLDQESAVRSLFRYLDREPKDEEEYEVASRLVDHVGCLPLAVATIAGYIKQSQLSLLEFFENIKHKATLWEKAPIVLPTQDHARSLFTVFEKAFEDLTPAARELLNILAFLDSDGVPEDMLMSAIENKSFSSIGSRNDLLDCYFELRTRQLIRRDTSGQESYISIHRVVQWNVLLGLSIDCHRRSDYFRKAFEIVRAMLPKPNPKAVPEADMWPPYAKHGRQLLALRTHCLWPDPPIELPLSFAQILAELGTYMWFSGKFPEGEKALETAENILDDNRARWTDKLRAHIHSMRGIIASFEGVSERARSMEFRKSAYKMRQLGDIGRKPEAKRPREEDMIYWNTHSDAAFGFIQEEDFNSTKNYMDECFKQYQKWEEVEARLPYEYAKYYQLTSFCHMAGQDPVRALEAISNCFELMKEAAGNDHPLVQLIKFCHANLLWHASKEARGEALKMNKAVLEFRRKILGEFSQFTLESYSTCGKLCYDAGEIELANEYLSACLQRRTRAVWNVEGVARAQFRHAKVLRALAKQEIDKPRINVVDHDTTQQAAKSLDEQAEKMEREVNRVIQRYRRDYECYMPPSEDEEQNLDQMVSIWAGRFTGGLVQR